MIADNMKALVANSSLIREMFEEGNRLAEQYGIEHVYDYSLGNPNVESPEIIKETIKDILDHEPANLVHGYMNNSGYEDVRQRIAEYTNTQYNTAVGYEHIIMTSGAAGGLNITFKAMLNPGDEVLVFAPFFGEYENYCHNYYGQLVVVPPNTVDFQPDVHVVEQYITPKTKFVLINSPNNPTGVIYTEKTIQDLTNLLEKKQKEYGHSIYLFSDEPYRELVYEGEVLPYILNYYKNSIVGYSYSKSLSLPGERIGYLVTHPELDGVEEVLSAMNVANRILGFVNAPSLFQRVVARTLGSEVDISIYKKSRDRLYDYLTDIGFEILKPNGAFYLFMKTPIEDDRQFCLDAKPLNLLMVPGSAFGCPGYVRLSYCISYERIVNSLPAFKKLMDLY